MSSAISTSGDLPAKAPSRRNGKGAPRDAKEIPKDVKDQGFRVSHFFVLLSLVAATVAVMMARPNAPENLILISLTIGAAGLAALAFYRTIVPLVDPRAEERADAPSARLRADLEREKALTLRSIKELEFDRAMGKLSQQDFDQMAGRLRARAMGIMKQLEAGAALYREQIERDLAARIGSPDLKVRPATEKAAEIDRRPDLQVGQCACGTSNDADARFCKACGAKLTGTETEKAK